ncbi:MAG TPA: diguanylate cyclase, partial [Gaiellaceae bacterium]|nr:diguanylate cyclase [Gaiellaceae bacterium]
VEGPGGRPVVATAGSHEAGDLAERTLAPLETRSFRAATIDWTYSPSGEPDDESFHSAVVAPLAASAGVPGTLVAYATAPNAFRPEHATILHELLAEVAPGIANARRFADVEARLLLDPETGVANRRGYEVVLGREVARAGRTGRPLSVVLVGISNGADTATTGSPQSVDLFARLLTRVTRRSDISCRRGDREFAILLPETRESGATVLTKRLREEARREFGTPQPPITVGHVELQPEESVEALETRAEAVLSPSRETRTGFPPPRPVFRPETSAAAAVQAHLVETADTLRRDVLEAVAHEIVDARPFGRPLAFVALHIEGHDELFEVDRESADAALVEVATRLSESVGSGSVLRLSASEFVLVLSGATADDAEALVGSLHEQADVEGVAGIRLTAGITELVERDGAQTALGRAEQALWQAKQAGPGTVVLAVPGRRTRLSE